MCSSDLIVYQKYSLFPHLSVLDNIALGPLLEKTTLPERALHLPRLFRERRVARADARRLIERVGLDAADAGKYPHELSGGMRQRVAIAQALIMQPKALLMDEPFGALDPHTREDMQLFMIEQWERLRMTVVFITHDLEEACFLGERVIALAPRTEGAGAEKLGAHIASDRRTPFAHPKPARVKFTPEFAEMHAAIRGAMMPPERQGPG